MSGGEFPLLSSWFYQVIGGYGEVGGLDAFIGVLFDLVLGVCCGVCLPAGGCCYIVYLSI
jgi:hypothetical protein